MLAVAESPQSHLQKPKGYTTPEQKLIGREVTRSIRKTLQQATKLKDLSFQAALDLAAPSSSLEESQELRARAQAIIALTKSWSEACNMIRIARNKPLPGSLRPEPKPKKSKSKMPTFSETKPD